MSKTDNLQDYLTAMANSFRYATNSTEKINAQDMLDLPVQLGDSYKELQRNISGEGYFETDVNVPLGINKIRSYAYNTGNNRLNNLTIPEGVETIQSSAFYHTPYWGKLYLPKSLKKVENGGFDTNDIRGVVYYNGNIKEFFSIELVGTGSYFGTSYGYSNFTSYANGGNLYINNEQVVDIVVPKEIINFKAPKGLGISGTFEFEEGTQVASITNIPFCKKIILPKGPYTIENKFDFNNITSPHAEEIYYKGTMQDYLTNVTPSTSTQFSDSIFASSGKLYIDNKLINNIVVPDGVYIIPAYIFYHFDKGGYTEVVIPESVQEIKTYSFCMGSLKDEIKIRILAKTPPIIQSNTFLNANNKVKFIVPASELSAFKSATNWSSQSSRIFPDSNIEVSIDSSLLNNENILYSVDGGAKQQFTNGTLSLQDVGTLTIYNTSTDTIKLGSTNGGTEVGTSGPNTTITYTFTDVSTLYITKA